MVDHERQRSTWVRLDQEPEALVSRAEEAVDEVDASGQEVPPDDEWLEGVGDVGGIFR